MAGNPTGANKTHREGEVGCSHTPLGRASDVTQRSENRMSENCLEQLSLFEQIDLYTTLSRVSQPHSSHV